MVGTDYCLSLYDPRCPLIGRRLIRSPVFGSPAHNGMAEGGKGGGATRVGLAAGGWALNSVCIFEMTDRPSCNWRAKSMAGTQNLE